MVLSYWNTTSWTSIVQEYESLSTSNFLSLLEKSGKKSSSYRYLPTVQPCVMNCWSVALYCMVPHSQTFFSKYLLDSSIRPAINHAMPWPSLISSHHAHKNSFLLCYMLLCYQYICWTFVSSLLTYYKSAFFCQKWRYSKSPEKCTSTS